MLLQLKSSRRQCPKGWYGRISLYSQSLKLEGHLIFTSNEVVFFFSGIKDVKFIFSLERKGDTKTGGERGQVCPVGISLLHLPTM